MAYYPPRTIDTHRLRMPARDSFGGRLVSDPTARAVETTAGSVARGIGGAATGALISGGLSLVGDGIGAIFAWKGMKKQMAENRRVERLNLRIRDEDLAREAKYRGEDKRERARLRQDEKDREKYNRAVSIINNFTSLMNRQPILAQNIIAMHRGRS